MVIGINIRRSRRACQAVYKIDDWSFSLLTAYMSVRNVAVGMPKIFLFPDNLQTFVY